MRRRDFMMLVRGVAARIQRKFTTLMNLESGKLVISASSI
jgi:hypothetical protein